LIGFLKKFGFYLTNKKTIYLIDSDNDVNFLISSLENEEILGIDTEFDWRTTYFPTLSLLQIATKGRIFLIDCLQCKNLKNLKNIIEDQDRLIIFHSSRSDATVLFTNLHIKVKNVFDIQIAEKIIRGGDIKNYASIVKTYLNISLNKSETNSNWLKRPFTKSQIDYAANDVRFLIKIYNKQKRILEKKNAYFTVKDLTKREVSLGSQKLYIPRLRKFKSQKKIEKDLFMWRENMAMERNVPPSYIFKDKYFKKILKAYDEDISKGTIYEILNNEKLANNLIDWLK
jgi:ribonuclease D